MTYRKPSTRTVHEIERVFAEITDYKEMITFFEEIFTPRELKDLTLRWQLLKDLHAGSTQRGIAEKYRISLCKITRGSKVLKKRDSAIRKILDALYGERQRY